MLNLKVPDFFVSNRRIYVSNKCIQKLIKAPMFVIKLLACCTGSISIHPAGIRITARIITMLLQTTITLLTRFNKPITT